MRRRFPNKISIRSNLTLKLLIMLDPFVGFKKCKALSNPNLQHPKVVFSQFHQSQLMSIPIVTFIKIIT